MDAFAIYSQSYYLINSSGTTVGNLSNAISSITRNTSAPSGYIGINYTKLNGGTGTVNFNIADTQTYRDGVSAARPTGIQDSLTLSSSNTGTTDKWITVYCKDDEEYEFKMSVNASAVYTAGKNDVDTYIIQDGTWYSSWTLNPGESVTFYPAKWINGSFSASTHSLKVTANESSGSSTSSSAIDMANSGQIWLHSSDPGSGYVNLGSLGSRILEGINAGSAYVSFQATCDGGTTYKYYKIPLK